MNCPRWAMGIGHIGHTIITIVLEKFEWVNMEMML